MHFKCTRIGTLRTPKALEWRKRKEGQKGGQEKRRNRLIKKRTDRDFTILKEKRLDGDSSRRGRTD